MPCPCCSCSCRTRELVGLISVLVEPVAELAAEDVNALARRYPPDHVIELVGLAAVFAARCFEAGRKRFGIGEFRRATAAIDDKLAVILRQTVRLEAARLMPDHREDV